MDSINTEAMQSFKFGIGGLPLAQLFNTYQSGTMLDFINTRYHVREDIGGLSAGFRKFFGEANGQNGVTIGETNMMQASQLEKGHWFTVNKIGVKISQRVKAGSKEIEDKQWYQNVLQTLVKYGIVRFMINGMAHVGEFRLSELVPSIQSVGQVGAIIESKIDGTNGEVPVALSVTGNTAPLMSAGVFNLKGKEIKLSEMINFWVELVWDIPSKVWSAEDKRFKELDVERDRELMVVPENTVVEIQLIGEELRAQG